MFLRANEVVRKRLAEQCARNRRQCAKRRREPSLAPPASLLLLSL